VNTNPSNHSCSSTPSISDHIDACHLPPAARRPPNPVSKELRRLFITKYADNNNILWFLTMTAPKPTILIIHGAWHTPAHYQLLVDALEKDGYPVECPNLPTCSASRNSKTPVDDIELIASVARRLVDDGKEVVAVAHSYGGIVASDALSGLGLKERQNAGLPGGVKYMVYVTAFLVPVGSCVEAKRKVREHSWANYDEVSIQVPSRANR
jgi:pimeloyl-ACP methyl ester carboxylesterase